MENQNSKLTLLIIIYHISFQFRFLRVFERFLGITVTKLIGVSNFGVSVIE